MTNYYPAWLLNAAGERELAIMNHPDAKGVQLLEGEDESERLAAHQQHIESPIGRITIDGRKKLIIA